MSDEKKHTGVDHPPTPETPVSDAHAHTHAAPAAVAESKKAFTKEDWDAENKDNKSKAWSATPQGRLAIRTFSRGVMGAAFFTVGGLWARKMMTYDHNQYNPNKSLGELFEEKNPFHIVTKIMDNVIGKPIEMGVTALGYNGVAATHFKPTKYSRVYENLAGHAPDTKVFGRTLGEEMLFTTFDFFCASIGDAMGRDIVGWFDPAVKKTWIDEKGDFKLPEAVNALGKSMFRYVTYNGGEDWAVALPYIYYVKFQRNMIDKHITPGYGFESDVGLNASSLKMAIKGKPHAVNGSFAVEAMMDYQGRFTAYNIGTLMYRELYDKADKWLHGKQANLYGAPDAPKDPNRTVLNDAVDIVKWTARSVIKGVIYMTPAMPFFSVTRVTQGRDRALFINSGSNSAMGFEGPGNKSHYVSAQDITDGVLGKSGISSDGLRTDAKVHYTHYDQKANGGLGFLGPLPNSEVELHIANPLMSGVKVYDYRNNVIENVFSWVGRTTSGFAKSMDNNVAKWLGGPNEPRNAKLRAALGLRPSDNSTRLTRGAINAAVSYMPYMYVKAELAKMWDTGKMDYAAERLVDGVFNANLTEIKAGSGEILNAVLDKPFADAEREREAQRRIAIDTSASDAFARDENKVSQSKQLAAQKKFDGDTKIFEDQVAALGEKHQSTKPAAETVPWQERVIKGRSEDGTVVATKHTPKGHAEREEMSKLLKAVQSPSNEIH